YPPMSACADGLPVQVETPTAIGGQPRCSPAGPARRNFRRSAWCRMRRPRPAPRRPRHTWRTRAFARTLDFLPSAIVPRPRSDACGDSGECLGNRGVGELEVAHLAVQVVAVGREIQQAVAA